MKKDDDQVQRKCPDWLVRTSEVREAGAGEFPDFSAVGLVPHATECLQNDHHGLLVERGWGGRKFI